MRKLLLFQFLIIVKLLLADSIIVNGVVSGEWSTDTVFVAGDLRIPPGENLYVLPGVKVIFQDFYNLDVKGGIEAIGSQSQPIIWTVNDTTGFYLDSLDRGAWSGFHYLSVNQDADSSIFQHCNFSFAKAVSSDTLLSRGGVFNIKYFDKIRIEQCVFENNKASFNGGAIQAFGADILIKDCSFYHNYCGPASDPWGYGGAVSADSSAVIIWNCYFEGNRSTGVGGGISVRFKDSQINNCTFNNNYSALGGGLSIGHYEEIQFTQCNNLFYDNSSTFFGGAISFLHASPILVNATVVRNSSAYGGGLYTIDSLTPQIYNSIVCDNNAYSDEGNQVYLWDAISSMDFFNCNLEGGYLASGGSGGGEAFSGQYINNLDDDPLFVDELMNDFRLMEESPCVNSGYPDLGLLQLPEVDLKGDPRVFQQTIDMGCYEFYLASLVYDDHIERIKVYPNPSTGVCYFIFPHTDFQFAELIIVDAFGRLIRNSKYGRDEMIKWDGKRDDGNACQKGIYYGQLILDGEIFPINVIIRK